MSFLVLAVQKERSNRKRMKTKSAIGYGRKEDKIMYKSSKTEIRFGIQVVLSCAEG